MTLPTIGSSPTSIVYPDSAVLPGLEMSHRLIRIGLDMLFGPMRLKWPVPGASAAIAIAAHAPTTASFIFKPHLLSVRYRGSRQPRRHSAAFPAAKALNPFAPPAQLASQ